jgi:hypothetical protein
MPSFLLNDPNGGISIGLFCVENLRSLAFLLFIVCLI